ncbi:MoaD/ThiS family protein [Aestuariibacter sp. AA17]|uniref:Molybdopterin synthase sulfur carrier subunit n=1 Tax=Fluctibacter corallii TaxID=2984329 RepID=A0ABT3A5Q8_9ALTE|nr:MoaD/ThiS family protein [Aestuariibacter sp. AA17]MCV2884021.1 MoaD/ThiS family protein [Aestuariibacter sp. AA17]
MVKVVFFGQTREVLNTPSILFEEPASNVAELRAKLQLRGDVWAEQLQSGKTLVAVNQTMASDDCAISANDEVAFFPPVTGG